MNKKISVMLIDDNKIDLFIHHELIKQVDIAHTISEYSFATQALKFLEDHGDDLWPDVILLDIYMPIMSGFDFLDKYANLSKTLRKNCHVFIVSSSLATEDKLKSNQNKMVVQLLEKPLNTDKLKSLLISENIV